MQKVSIQRPLVDSAGPRPKATRQTDPSEKLVGSTQLRNPLKELRPSPGGQNVDPRPPTQTEASGTVEFVADPAALATILSGEGVKSCRLGRQPSLAQRVLVRGSQGGTIRRGQDARASAYLAPRTPIHRLDPARASCFSRLEGPGPRGRTLCPQRLEALELRRETGGGLRTSVSQASGLLAKTPVQPASSLPEGEHEIVTHSDEGGGGPLGLAQRVPLKETRVPLKETREIPHTKDGRDSCPMPSPGRVVPPAVARPSPFGRAQRVPSPGPSVPVCIHSSWGLGRGRALWLGSLLSHPHLSPDLIFSVATSRLPPQNPVHTPPIGLQSSAGPLVEWPLPSALPRRACSALGADCSPLI